MTDAIAALDTERKDTTMRTISTLTGATITGVAVATLLASGLACQTGDHAVPAPAPSGPTTVAIKDAPALPPTYTEAQCTAVISSFPGWNNVAPVPATDAQGRPTLWYALIPITAADQLADLATVGIDVETMPIFTDDAADAAVAGQTGVVSKSTCGGAQLVWAVVPGPVFNAIIQATAGAPLSFNAIVLQPVPDVFADTTLTYQSLHPISYQALHDAGFAYLGVSAPPPGDNGDPGTQARSLWSTISSVTKSVVRTVAGLTHEVPEAVESGIGWIDRELQGSVDLTVHLDLRNTDAAFGGPIGDVAGDPTTDRSTKMLRTWGAQAGAPLPLSGVTVAARQKTLQIGGFGITTRFTGTTDAGGTARMSVTKGKATGICLDLENDAATVNDYFTRMEICSFEKGDTTATGQATTARSYTSDTTLDVELQNKYLNLLAQLTDGRAYLNDVAHYAAHKASVLAGPMANALSPLTKGRAVTPCLGLPDGALDLVDSGLIKAASLIPPPVGGALAVALAAFQAMYEVDMWIPDDGENLTSRGVASHEYGHFAMCSMLVDEDKTKMIEIPSMLIQRIIEGSYMDVGDETTRVMEAWADFFAGQTAGGYNYFSLENGAADPQGIMGYCDGSRDATAGGACWDWNYVEDTTARTDPSAPLEDIGTPLQMRRVATTLFDAFDGHPRGGDDPGQGDFWQLDPATHLFTVAGAHRGDAHDESIALPGAAMRTLMHNWTHATGPLEWQVTEQQLFGALNRTIRDTPKDPSRPLDTYSWCDACALFAQHASKTCTLAFESTSNGECVSADGPSSPAGMPWSQLIAACAQAPTSDIIGAPPSPTDPTSACTFAGCPARTILTAPPGDPMAACAACGAHQISVDGRTCLDCDDAQIIAGPEGNTCVTCPALQIPNAQKTACVPCGDRQIAVGTTCVACPAATIASPDGSCESCPPGQLVYGNTCIPAAACTCGAGSCRAPAPTTSGVCIDIVG
jgi:hypothetical protein